MNYYTNVQTKGDNILYRGIENGKRVTYIDNAFKPTLYITSAKTTDYTSIQGDFLDRIEIGSISDARDFLKQYEDINNFKVYGNTDYKYQYISDKFPDEIHYDMHDIVVVTLDIETESEERFAPADDPTERINVITIKNKNTGLRHTFCLNKTITTFENTIIECYDSEEEMLKAFISEFKKIDPDVITGWNIRFYDIPYIVNRCYKLLGEKATKELSPWNWIKEEEIEYRGKTCQTFRLVGISILDLYELYRKYSTQTLESYSLNHVAKVELNKTKLDYTEYDSMHEFYTKDFDKFVMYNIQDVDIVDELDNKLNLIDLHIGIAYVAKCNFEDVFGQVKTWDCIIYNYLKNKNIVIPLKKEGEVIDGQYAGAYVKDPRPGFKDWIISFDLTSLYPSLIIQYSIGSDTIIEKNDLLSKISAEKQRRGL
jgi:DNA polymerase elongation subunit (family B)